MENKQPIFMVVGEIEGTSLVPYRSFEDFRERSGEIADINKEYGLFSKDPISLLFSTTTMVSINDHDYAPIVKKVLEIQIEDYTLHHGILKQILQHSLEEIVLTIVG